MFPAPLGVLLADSFSGLIEKVTLSDCIGLAILLVLCLIVRKVGQIGPMLQELRTATENINRRAGAERAALEAAAGFHRRADDKKPPAAAAGKPGGA